MALFNHATKEVTTKLVYYGPGLCGKTTNLQWIHDHLAFKSKGKLLSLATESDRTLFFDFLPVELGTIRGMRTRMQIYTVPGQVFYESTRRMVLKGCDAVVFVADSQAAMLDANFESLQSLRNNLVANEIDPSIPMVLQYNKRDLPTALPISVLNARLNPRKVPFFEAVAFKGIGVEETLRGITKALFQWLSEYYETEEPTAEPAPPVPEAKEPAAPAPGRVVVRVATPTRPPAPPAPVTPKAGPSPDTPVFAKPTPVTIPPAVSPAKPKPVTLPPAETAPARPEPPGIAPDAETIRIKAQPAPPPKQAAPPPEPRPAAAAPPPKPVAPPPKAAPPPPAVAKPPTPAPERQPALAPPVEAKPSAPAQPPAAAKPEPARTPPADEPEPFVVVDEEPEPAAPPPPARVSAPPVATPTPPVQARPTAPPPAPGPPRSEPPVFREPPKPAEPRPPSDPPPRGEGLHSDQWLYLLDGTQRGPIDVEDLIDLVLTSIPEDTKVWHPGLDGWVRAKEMREIAEEIPPPLPIPGAARAGYVEEDFPDFNTVPPTFRTALIADEDEAFRRYLAMPLAAQGFTIWEAADGAAAWQLAVQHRPWLVLADVSMPEVDGFEFCRRVRNHPMLDHTPLLFVSGSDKYKERYRALQIGADDFLSKQMPIRELLMRIQLLLTRYSDLGGEPAEKQAGATAVAGALEGRVEVFGAPALMQICNQGRLSGIFTARAEDEANTVAVFGFRDGEIIAATAGDTSGAEAVYSFLGWEKGSFKFSPGDPGIGQPLAQSVEHLLLEGCRRLDESRRGPEDGAALEGTQ